MKNTKTHFIHAYEAFILQHSKTTSSGTWGCFSFLVSISHCISHYHILFIAGVSSTGEPWKQTPAQLIANKSHIGGFILAEKHKNRVCV